MADNIDELKACIRRIEHDISLLESRKRQNQDSFRKFHSACLLGGGFLVGLVIGYGADFQSLSRTTRVIKSITG